MSNRDAAVLAFKVLGASLAILTFIFTASSVVLWSAELRAGYALWAVLTTAALTLGAAYASWFAAAPLATHIFPEESPPSAGLHVPSLLALALCVIGVVLVTDALPRLVKDVVLFQQGRAAAATFLGWDPERAALVWDATAKAETAASLVRLTIGLALLAGPAKLSAALARVRLELGGARLTEEEPGPAAKE
jgi:hypothetical protein